MSRPDKTFRVGAWLGAFAMLMVFLGPLLGQGSVLLHAEHGQPIETPHCMDMPGMSMQHSAITEHSTAGSDLAGWEKCGYCSLLFQHPALCHADIHLSRALAPMHALHHEPVHTRQVDAPTFPGARSRAPPLLIG